MTYLVGIAGGSGSGKGTISQLICTHLSLWGVKAVILSTDDCYKDISFLTREERDGLCFNSEKNFDHPSMVDFDRLIAYAQNLKKGRSFDYPKYDFSIHTFGDKKEHVPEGLDVAIIEGIYSLYSGSEIGKNLVSLYDYKIFVATTPEIAQNRRILRDSRERGRKLEHIIKQLNSTVIPMQKQFVYPTQINADDLVDWRADESTEPQRTIEALVSIARQKALGIYEAVKGKVLPSLNPQEVLISGLR